MILKPVFSLIMEITYLTSKNKDATDKELRVIEDFEHLKTYHNK